MSFVPTYRILNDSGVLLYSMWILFLLKLLLNININYKQAGTLSQRGPWFSLELGLLYVLSLYLRGLFQVLWFPPTSQKHACGWIGYTKLPLFTLIGVNERVSVCVFVCMCDALHWTGVPSRDVFQDPAWPWPE